MRYTVFGSLVDGNGDARNITIPVNGASGPDSAVDKAYGVSEVLYPDCQVLLTEAVSEIDMQG